jgi:riboflavin synthase
MFTGIVEGLGRIADVESTKHGTFSLSVELRRLSQRVKIGDSVAINGVCLSVISKHKTTVSFDVIAETLRCTNLRELVKGSSVNVERSLRLSDRIDGHLVMGHVDGVSRIVGIEKEGDQSIKMWFREQDNLISWMIPKGAIALDGISLTLVDVQRNKFSVSLIPHTLMATNFGKKKLGDLVNVEVDFFGKFVKKFLGELDLREVRLRSNS